MRWGRWLGTVGSRMRPLTSLISNKLVVWCMHPRLLAQTAPFDDHDQLVMMETLLRATTTYHPTHSKLFLQYSKSWSGSSDTNSPRFRGILLSFNWSQASLLHFSFKSFPQSTVETETALISQKCSTFCCTQRSVVCALEHVSAMVRWLRCEKSKKKKNEYSRCTGIGSKLLCDIKVWIISKPNGAKDKALYRSFTSQHENFFTFNPHQ